MEVIRTERLILRPFRSSDQADLSEFLSQLKEDEFEGYPDLTPERGREQLQRRLCPEEFLAVEIPSEGKVIGNLYCGRRPYGAREVGFIIHEKYRRQGYGTEALTALLEALFREGVHRVYAECDPGNVRSWKLLEKAGMTREAHFRRNVYFFTDANGDPKWKDTYVYAVREPKKKAREPGGQ